MILAPDETMAVVETRWARSLNSVFMFYTCRSVVSCSGITCSSYETKVGRPEVAIRQ